MSNDEIEYAISSKSYALYARDISGYGFPLSLLKTQTDGAISPIPPLLLSPLFLIFPLDQITIRTVYVFISLLTALCLYFLVTTLFRKKTLGLMAVILFLINPWSIYLSRQATESPFALLFYLAGIVTLLRVSRWKLILSFLLFILAFFSYHGGKFIFLPIILLCLAFRLWSNEFNKIRIKSAAIFITCSLIFILSYILISRLVPDSILFSRSSDLFFTDNQKMASLVNEERRLTIDNPLKDLISNKPSAIFKVFVSQYLTAFSPDVLYLGGDLRATYRFGEHGLFYLFDIPLILLGLVGLYAKKRRIFYFLMGLVVISPIATAVSRIEISVINRSFLLLPIFIILSSFGLMELFNIFIKRTVRITVALLVIFLIAVSSINFYYFYLLKFPILGQENYWLSERVLDKYLAWNSSTQPTEILVNRPRSSLLRWTFLSDDDTQREMLSNPIPYDERITSFKFRNITFAKSCPDKFNRNTLYAIARDVENCSFPPDPVFSILNQKDSGTIINIYNSTICSVISKDFWRRFNYISDYSIEGMNYDRFCSTWIAYSPK